MTYHSFEDQIQAVTPNFFLKFYCNPNLILKLEPDEIWAEPNPDTITQTLEVQEEVFNNFKALCYEGYLLSLSIKSMNLFEANWENQIKIGDIVLIKLPNKPRPFWLLGRVLEVIVGHDDKIRSVKVKQANNKIVQHSINNLYPLELSITHPEKNH